MSGDTDDPLKTRRAEITVVYVDLRGFTGFTKTAEPEEVMSVLRQYDAELGRLVVEYDGTIEHMAGDGMMVLFNAPMLPAPLGESHRQVAGKTHCRLPIGAGQFATSKPCGPSPFSDSSSMIPPLVGGSECRQGGRSVPWGGTFEGWSPPSRRGMTGVRNLRLPVTQ